MKIAPHWHHDTRMTTDLRRALVIAAPANPIVATWRWRYEIALLMGLTAYLTLGITSAGVLPTIIVFVFIALTILCLPPTRQFALNHAWRIITPHRIRVGCAEAMIYSSRGKIPVILWTTRQPFGERALLLCRAGTNINDFISSRAILTTACWAQDIAVLPDIRRPHLVTLDVIRRPPYHLDSEVKGSRATDHPDETSGWPGGEEI
jgi:hypothetical protein